MYKVFNMGHCMEIYVDSSNAQKVIEISHSFGIDAQIVGYTEASDRNELIIESDKGRFEYRSIPFHTLTKTTMLIIGIAGGTGSGKTTVVRKIIESLPAGQTAVIPQDSYYWDSSHIPVEERQNINFDEPAAIDFNLLVKHLKELKAGHLHRTAHIFVPDMYPLQRDNNRRAPRYSHRRRYSYSLQ